MSCGGGRRGKNTMHVKQSRRDSMERLGKRVVIALDNDGGAICSSSST